MQHSPLNKPSFPDCPFEAVFVTGKLMLSTRDGLEFKMGTLMVYFMAPDDSAAAGVIDWFGGPDVGPQDGSTRAL